jgi:putative hemolysin
MAPNPLRSNLATAVAGAIFLLPASVPAVAAAADDLAAARDYCESVGGTVQHRQAMWDTNADPTLWVDLGRGMDLCRFQAQDEARSRIYVDVLTLWSDKPSLAAAAYLSKMPLSDDVPPGNPATHHCASLAGSSQFGLGAANGGWVDPDDPDDPVVALCVFPDGSAIDEWGIAYHGSGAVRGADLSTLFRADPSGFPPIFG